MSERVLTLIALIALATPAAPARAQAFPEGIGSIVRDTLENVRGVARYQQGREEQTDRQTKTVRIGANGELSLGNVAGDIVVTRANGNEVTVEIVKTARARTAGEAREMLGLVEVTVSERQGRADVKTAYPGDERRNNRRNINVSVAYTVSAPAGTRLTVSSVSGSIKVTDIKGDLTLNSVSGSVRIASAGHIATAKSVSGNVEIVDTQVDGEIEAQSVSGNVSARKISARQLTLGSISGEITVQDVQCERVESHSISGNVEYSGVLAKSGRYEFQSHSGDVRLTVTGGTGFELEANTFSGELRSDLPLKMDRSDSDRRGRQRTLRGVWGDGSAVVNITTFSGNVVIAKR
ncbi:MAG: DUF4097 family beta strand repeat-containing protein [Acidobacteriota bacterium]